jgi:hypothetical protein
MRYAFGKSVHQEDWDSTGRDTDQLVKDALTEVRQAIAEGSVDEPGPASLELAVRAAFPLVVSGRLMADRGTFGNEQPDRRNPGEVLDTMRQTPQGVPQLGQALHDFAAERPILAVDEDGHVKSNEDGSGDLAVNDIYLRAEFPPPGKGRTNRPENTPTDHYHNQLNALSTAMEALERAFVALGEVIGDDGHPLVDTRGVDYRTCAAWRGLLARIDEELVVWSRTFKRAYGAGMLPRRHDENVDEEAATVEDDILAMWDKQASDETADA